MENKRKKDNKKKSEKSDSASNVALTSAPVVEEKPISRSIEEKPLAAISPIPLEIPKPSKKEKKSESKKEKKPPAPKEESLAQKSLPTTDRKDSPESASDEDKMPNLVSDDDDGSEAIPEVNGDVSDDEKVPTLMTEEDEGSDIEDQFKQYCTTIGDTPDISLNRRDRIHAPNDQGFLTSLANTLGFGKRVDATTIRPYTHSQKEECIFLLF